MVHRADFVLGYSAMAKPEDIPSDLTLEIGGNLSPDRFMAAARAFFGCVEEISKSIATQGEDLGWIVRTREGSHLLGLDPAPGVNPSLLKAVYRRIKHGVDHLSAGEIDTVRLPDAAIRHLKTLSELSDRPRRNPIQVRLWIEKRPNTIGHDIAKTILESWGDDYRDFGTIEGKLEAIQDRNALQIRVFDALLRQTVICHVTEDKLAEAFANFRKRVEVSGIIHYRRNGTPVSIDVESIEALPDDALLPSLDEVRGILRTEE
jgi:hypothetical protein